MREFKEITKIDYYPGYVLPSASLPWLAPAPQPPLPSITLGQYNSLKEIATLLEGFISSGYNPANLAYSTNLKEFKNIAGFDYIRGSVFPPAPAPPPLPSMTLQQYNS